MSHTILLSYENDEWHCPRIAHAIGTQKYIYYEIHRLDSNIGKVTFYATPQDQLLSGVPHGVRLFDSNGTQCPLDGKQFTIVWWESYNLMYGSEIMCRLTAQRIHGLHLGAKSRTKEQELQALKKSSINTKLSTLPLGNDDSSWRTIDQFLHQSHL